MTEARPTKGQSNKDRRSCTNEVFRHIEVPLQDCTLKLSDVSAPLGKLLEEDILWHWEVKHQQSFENLMKLLSNTPLLKF